MTPPEEWKVTENACSGDSEGIQDEDELDQVQELIGNMGRAQAGACGLILAAGIPAAWQIMARKIYNMN